MTAWQQINNKSTIKKMKKQFKKSSWFEKGVGGFGTIVRDYVGQVQAQRPFPPIHDNIEKNQTNTNKKTCWLLYGMSFKSKIDSCMICK